ncbi:RQC-minor-1 family DNA-binding protein [Ammoniphilus sp. 3BR4]|uniref:RQC-minor-1 family DNA-binding protein n=1 Tax=Ammoniphilus sp. 3BR4 TaxID=3158265 RepID=UPI0034659C98
MNMTVEDIRTILRAADDIIASGGRTLLAKILKGSKEKKVLELGLQTNPSYGCFKSLKLDEIMEKIDWMIHQDFLEIEYSGKMPLIVYSDKGWEIERDQYADELLHQWNQWLDQGITAVNMNYLKDRNRGLILLLLEKIKESGDKKYIPFLQQWEKIDYKKVRDAIRDVIQHLQEERGTDPEQADLRERRLADALEVRPNQPEWLKCRECGERFLFETGEREFYKIRGFAPPKRCPDCREKRWFGID